MKTFLKFALGFVRGSRMAVSFALGRGGSGLSFCLLIYRDFAYCGTQEKNKTGRVNAQGSAQLCPRAVHTLFNPLLLLVHTEHSICDSSILPRDPATK